MTKLTKNKSFVIFLLAQLTFSVSLFAKEFLLDQKTYELNIPENRLLVMEFPFTIKDWICFGQESDWQPGQIKDRTVYFSIHTKKIGCVVWDENSKSTLINFTTGSEHTEQHFTFFYGNEEYKENNKWQIKIWNEDKEVAYLIDEFAESEKLLGFRNTLINKELNLNDKIKVTKTRKSENMKFVIEEWLLTNISEGMLDLHILDELYDGKENSFNLFDNDRLRGHSFDQRYLAPGHTTKAFYVFYKKK